MKRFLFSFFQKLKEKHLRPASLQAPPENELPPFAGSQTLADVCGRVQPLASEDAVSRAGQASSKTLNDGNASLWHWSKTIHNLIQNKGLFVLDPQVCRFVFFSWVFFGEPDDDGSKTSFQG